jgi:IS605 OrfB family transposase
MEHKTNHAIALHQLCYKKCRVQFGLSANLAIRSIRRTAHCLTRLKRKRKPPRHFSPKSIDYDARIFTYNDEKEIVSLTTTRGRVRIPLILGGFQRNLLKGKSPTAAQVIKKGGFWYIHIVVEVENAKLLSNSAIGIDCGITNLVATSNGTIIEGKTRQNFKQLRAKIRASLQSKGSKGSKKILKRLSGKENRRIRYENHVIAKQIVEEAQRHNCGLIRMERLTHIRQRTKTWNKHLNKMVAGWSFFQLQQFVAYKAEEVGIAIEFVDPAYTSQTCHKCLCLGSRTGERFTCLTCGEQHADVNASRVVALGGAACKPARISTLPKD